jgi:hypothetical protein
MLRAVWALRALWLVVTLSLAAAFIPGPTADPSGLSGLSRTTSAVAPSKVRSHSHSEGRQAQMKTVRRIQRPGSHAARIHSSLAWTPLRRLMRASRAIIPMAMAEDEDDGEDEDEIAPLTTTDISDHDDFGATPEAIVSRSHGISNPDEAVTSSPTGTRIGPSFGHEDPLEQPPRA